MGEVKQRQVLLCGGIFALMTAYAASWFSDTWKYSESWPLTFLSGSVMLALIIACLVCVDIWYLKPADSHTLISLLSQYLMIIMARIMQPYAKFRMNQLTKNPMKANTKALMKLIRTNQDTIYGQQYMFSEIHSLEDFVKKHPVTTDVHLKPWMDRVMADEHNVLFPEKPAFLASTSGTTGSPKVYALCPSYLKKIQGVLAYMSITFLPMLNLKRLFRFHIFSKVKRTPGGLPIGAGSQAMLQFPPFNLMPKSYHKLFEEDASYYAMCLFALAEKELFSILSFSADLTYAYMKFMVVHWEDFCSDIENGSIGKAFKLPEAIRQELSTLLKADPERAAFLRQEKQKGIVGLAKRVWPDLAFITIGKAGGFKFIATKLMETYFKGLKAIDVLHGATEGITGINLDKKPEEGQNMTLFPEFCFMEFIPLEDVDNENPKTVQIDQLNVGSCYEVVHTNENGLYRCRYGDIIKITGHHNKMPTYEFLYRLGQRLNIAYERTPEKFLYEAIKKATPSLPKGVTIADYTTTESTMTDSVLERETKGNYVFFIEYSRTLDQQSVTDFAEKVDEFLMDMYELYKRYRDIGSIENLEIIQIKAGTMDGVKKILMGDKVNPQFKMPRVIRKLPVIKHLLENNIMRSQGDTKKTE